MELQIVVEALRGQLDEVAHGDGHLAPEQLRAHGAARRFYDGHLPTVGHIARRVDLQFDASHKRSPSLHERTRLGAAPTRTPRPLDATFATFNKKPSHLKTEGPRARPTEHPILLRIGRNSSSREP